MTTDCKSSSSSKEQDCFTATRRGDFKTLLGFSLFCFSYVREIKMTSFSYFSNYFKIIYHEFI